MRTLCIGPWAGEFGWELFRWQGHFRTIAKQYDRVVVACRASSTALYDDYAAEFFLVNHSTEACAHQFVGDHSHAQVKCTFAAMEANGAKWYPAVEHARLHQTFAAYGIAQAEHAYDIVFHARSTPKRHFGGRSLKRNWPENDWHDLLAMVRNLELRMCCVGLEDEALSLPYCDDLRGADLARVMNVLRSSRMLVGPNSGPTHLAALCKCNVVAWCDPRSQSTAERIKRSWNPFNVRAKIHRGLRPEPGRVMAMIGSMLKVARC